jgi:hypothetical protein
LSGESARCVPGTISLVVSPGNAWAETIVLVMAAIIGESVLRGTFVFTINRIGVILAPIALVVLFVQFAEWIIVNLLVALAVFLLTSASRSTAPDARDRPRQA